MPFDQAKLRRERKDEVVRLLGGRCRDCGFKGPGCCFHLDHRRPLKKSASPSQFVRLGSHHPDFRIEIKKCDLVCANCHAIRTSGNSVIRKKISEGMKRAWARRENREFSGEHKRKISESLRRTWASMGEERKARIVGSRRKGYERAMRKRYSRR